MLPPTATTQKSHKRPMDEWSMDEAADRLRSWGIADDHDGASEPEDEDDGEDTNGAHADSTSVPCRASLSRRRVYTNEFKLEVIELMLGGANAITLAKEKQIKSRPSIYAWLAKEEKIREACANKMKSKVCVGGQGRPTTFPHEDEVVQWIKDMRREDFPLKTSHVVKYMSEEFEAWVRKYSLKNKIESLFRFVQRLIHRRGFSFKKPNRTLLSSDDLRLEQDAFVRTVASGINTTYSRNCIFNADETGVYFEEDCGKIISEKGSKKSTKVWGRKRSSRVTVLLTVNATGRKLRPLIIFKGESGGTIIKEFETYPNAAVYAVQTNAWMDGVVWKGAFVEDLWCDYIDTEQPGPLVIYVDNFKCHTSDESVDAFAFLGTEVAPLPKNTTAVLQPLDVGVMGPFKKKLRALALSDEIESLPGSSGLSLRQRLVALSKKSLVDKRRDVALRVIKAWDSVTEASIVRAWEKSGLIIG